MRFMVNDFLMVKDNISHRFECFLSLMNFQLEMLFQEDVKGRVISADAIAERIADIGESNAIAQSLANYVAVIKSLRKYNDFWRLRIDEFLGEKENAAAQQLNELMELYKRVPVFDAKSLDKQGVVRLERISKDGKGAIVKLRVNKIEKELVLGEITAPLLDGRVSFERLSPRNKGNWRYETGDPKGLEAFIFYDDNGSDDIGAVVLRLNSDGVIIEDLSIDADRLEFDKRAIAATLKVFINNKFGDKVKIFKRDGLLVPYEDDFFEFANNKAMSSKVGRQLGGIDLNKVDQQISVEGQGENFALGNPQDDLVQIESLTPRITGTEPLRSLPAFLGVN